MTPGAGAISVSQTLALLDGQFLPVAVGVAENRYALWLGSGISLGRVAGLRTVILKVLEHLRIRINPAGGDCRFRNSLNTALGLVLSADEQTQVDFAQPVAAWPNREEISNRLSATYSNFLNVGVVGEQDDYLVWNGIEVVATYANPTLEPDIEHLCIAVLMLEGVASDVASANWDGLIEKAVFAVSGEHPCVVHIRGQDLQRPAGAAQLIKFHGCAVKAGEDEATYRAHIVGRQDQIFGWREQNPALATRLLDLIGSKPTLMLGLSVQDANIQMLFSAAQQTNPWTWPGDRPSIVFSEDTVGALQGALLQNVYRGQATPANKPTILAGALIRSFASRLLTALVLHVCGTKLAKLLELAPGTLTVAAKQDLKPGILALRNRLAIAADADRLKFIQDFIDETSRARSLYRDGRAGAAPRRYQPLTPVPLLQIGGPDLASTGLAEVATALAVLGLGVRDGHWNLNGADPTDPASGAFTITNGASSAKVLLADNSSTGVRLRKNGHIAVDDDTVVIYSLELAPTVARSPSSPPGRTGKVGLREVSMNELLASAGSSDELMQNFRAGIGL